MDTDDGDIADRGFDSSMKSVLDRYYLQYYANDIGGEKQDHYVYQHLNQLLVVGLARTHPAVAGGVTVSKVEFNTGNKRDRPNGSGKKGGILLQPDSALCVLTCSDGATYTVRSCVRGSLLELNERLSAQPQLLNDKCETDGYVAIIQARPNDQQSNMARLIGRQQFHALRGLT
eukprot:TRINITY_DN32555_c0_g1_i1.p1 TRINITY_DN32555_c0_g1~~TRINITY_DN32555_c0_g1_i1.p1  ORF type:complete len:174 (-),score=37.71 TRINITY_DN32555_c0_g1_i1:103-624(-)